MTEENIKQSNELILRLGWTVEEAKQHLLSHFNKRSRYLLDANEWANYLQELEIEALFIRNLPSHRETELLSLVNSEYNRLDWSEREGCLYLFGWSKGKQMTPKGLTPDELKNYVIHLQSLPANSKKAGNNSNVTHK